MARIYLNKTHPGLFRGILAVALSHYLAGVLIFYGTLAGPPRHNIFLSWLFTAAFFVVGSIQLYGLFAPHYIWVRRGLLLGLALIGWLAVVFISAISTTLKNPETIRLAWLVTPWPFWAYAQYLQLEEPPENPTSEIK